VTGAVKGSSADIPNKESFPQVPVKTQGAFHPVRRLPPPHRLPPPQRLPKIADALKNLAQTSSKRINAVAGSSAGEANRTIPIMTLKITTKGATIPPSARTLVKLANGILNAATNANNADVISSSPGIPARTQQPPPPQPPPKGQQPPAGPQRNAQPPPPHRGAQPLKRLGATMRERRTVTRTN
jgi:hypothetical protein